MSLDDPDRRNALNAEMVDEIVATFDALEADDAVGAVVVTGKGTAFCAGADLSHLGGSRRAGLRTSTRASSGSGRSPLPTIAAVNGAAVGAGMNLALVCDVRLAVDLGPVRHPVPAARHPPRRRPHLDAAAGRSGPGAARAMVLFGEVLDGAEAETAGLVWRCVDDDDLLDAANEHGRPRRRRSP